LKEDIDLYLNFINKLSKKCSTQKDMWEITCVDIPNNIIAYNIFSENEKGFDTIIEKQRRIYWIKPSDTHNKFRFAMFQRSIGFQTKGLWKKIRPINIDDVEEDLWEFINLDNNEDKKRIDKSSLGPHTSEEAQKFENEKIEEAKKIHNINCQQLYFILNPLNTIAIYLFDYE
jgi:hypothetical protein